jgi:hypothetical protein
LEGHSPWCRLILMTRVALPCPRNHVSSCAGKAVRYSQTGGEAVAKSHDHRHTTVGFSKGYAEDEQNRAEGMIPFSHPAQAAA